MSQVTTGYAPVNGLKMYYEAHGAGRPLVLLHGGLLTIDLSFGKLLPDLVLSRQVIATELQGHGRTGDIERDIELRSLAGDVAALLDHLGVEQADLFGFSLGGGVALQLALPPGDLGPGAAGHVDANAHGGRFPGDARGLRAARAGP